MYYELFFYCVITSFVACGFFEATNEGQLLYFLKRPVLKWIESIENEKLLSIAEVNQEQEAEVNNREEYFKLRRESISKEFDRQKRIVSNMFKPIFLCTRCMASLWSIAIWFPLTVNSYGYHVAFYFLIPVILIGVTINAIISEIIH